MAKSRTPLSVEDRLKRLELRAASNRDRILLCERALRIIGLEFEKSHLTEAQAMEWAGRAHHLHNTMRDIRSSIGKHGNEFDRAPHFTDPWRDLGVDEGAPRANDGDKE